MKLINSFLLQFTFNLSIKRFFFSLYQKSFFLDGYNVNKNFDFKTASERLASKERLVELERTNLNLRRMIQLMSEDATRSESATLKLLPNRTLTRKVSSSAPK